MADSFGRSARSALGAGLVLIVATAGLARAADEPKAKRWVSSDAVIYLEVPHPAFLIDRVADPKLRALVDVVPGYRDRLNKAIEGEQGRKLRGLLKVVEEKLGMPWNEALLGLTGGGVVAAVEVSPGKIAGPQVIVIVTPKDPALPKRVTDLLVDLARQDAAGKGEADPVISLSHRGVTAYGVGPGAVAVVEGRLAFANTAETLKTVIDRALDGLPEKASIEGDEVWRARQAEVTPDTMAWALAKLDRLKKLDPKRFSPPEKPDTGQTVLLGGWIDTVRRASWVSAALTWTDQRLAAGLTVATPPGSRSEAYKGFVPPKGSGAPRLANPPGTVLSVGLWRDLAALWEARADLIGPEAVQQLAGLDTFAGQFFGGRDFGSGVLGALTPDMRVVVAMQDHAAMKPTPDVKLPAFALILDLKPDDEDFAQRLKVAFQSFIGLVNLGAAQTKAPPLELGSESFEGVTISTSNFVPPKPALGDKDDADAKEPVHLRQNFTPSAAQVGDHFVISSSVGLARELVKSLKAPPGKPEEGTLVAEADGPTLAQLVTLNRSRLVMQNMLDRGNDKEQAEAQIDLLAGLLRYLGHARASVRDGDDALRVGLEFSLGR